MPERTGWICLHRSMLDHALIEQLPAPWLRIWIVILLMANWKPGLWWNGREEISIAPGSLVISLDKLASKSGSGVQQVRSALNYLSATGMITREATCSYTTITVVNWAAYQERDPLDNTVDDTLDGKPVTQRQHTDNIPVTTIEQSNNTTREYMSKSGRKPGIDPDIRLWFETEFWPIYPRHEARQKSLEAANKKATDPEKRAFYLDRLNAQLPEYNRRKAESGQRVIPLGATWFNQDRADDDLPTQAPAALNPRRIVDSDYPEYVSLGAGK